MHIYPYVYRLDHPITGEFYIGVRWANKVPAQEDLGHKYFTSSKTVKPRFHEFHYQVLAEFFDKDDAYDFEQQVIIENWASRTILNNAVQRKQGVRIKIYKRGKTGTACAANTETQENIGMVSLEDPRWKTGEIVHFNKNKKKPDGFSEKLRKANTGKKHSNDTIEKLRKISKGKQHSIESKTKRREAMSHMIWVNNGERNARILPEMGEQYFTNGWVVGRVGKTNQYD